MEKKVICFFLIQTLMWKIPETLAQRSIQQYLHLTGPQYSTINAPTTTHSSATNNPICSDNQNQITNLARPTTGLPSFAALSLPSLINTSPSNLINLPPQPQTKQPCDITPRTSNIDGNLLNNLAIALQLLLLGNLLTTTAEKSKEIIAEIPQNHLSQISYTQSQDNCDLSQNSYSLTQNSYNPSQNNYNPTQSMYNQPQNNYNPTQNSYSTNSNTQNQYYTSLPEQLLPSANLIGIPNIGNMDQPSKRTRSTMNLMSPYEALAKSSYSDTTSYTPSISRRDIQSPYSVIDSNIDFFPMNDLF